MKVIQTRRNRQTKTLVDVVDRGHEDGEERWETICVQHATVCSHTTRSLAVYFAASPVDWCEECQTDYFTSGRSGWG